MGMLGMPKWLIDVTNDPKEKTGTFICVCPRSRLDEFPEDKIVLCKKTKTKGYVPIKSKRQKEKR